ncbi:MAG: ImmA/IrrE family metallo-endopeptidase [Sphingomicrobium sp.]
MQPILEFAIDEMVPGAYLAVLPDNDMDGAEGRTDCDEPVITLSAGSYASLHRGDPRARMTAAHELGHLLMHYAQPVFYYRTRSRDHCFEPEWQADYFAGALLMPREALVKLKTVSKVMAAFGVSRGAALRRSREINHRIIDDKVRSRKKGYGMNRTP